MTQVLVIVGAPPREPSVVAQAVTRLREAGAAVRVACFFDPAILELPADVAETHDISDVRALPHGRARRASARANKPRRVWVHAYHNTAVRDYALGADVLAAVDVTAVHAVWEFAHRNPRADAVYGTAPALRAVRAAPHRGSLSRLARLRRRVGGQTSIAARGIRRAGVTGVMGVAVRLVGRSVMRTGVGAVAWRHAVTAPGLPDRVRSGLTVRVYRSMVEANRLDDARRTAVAVSSRFAGVRARAESAMRQAEGDLARGRVPLDLGGALRAQLALADSVAAAGDAAGASSALLRAFRLASHRVLHFDRLASPLAADPESFMAPFRDSSAVAALSRPRGRSTPAASRPTGRPSRLLFVTLANDNFLREIRARYEGLPDVEVRYLDLNDDSWRRPLAGDALAYIEDVLAGGGSYRDAITDWLRPHLDWADTVFVDWCLAPAALFTLVDPGSTRIIVRLHSFELFSVWPHLIDFSRVDDMIFVGAHIRDLMAAAYPQLTGGSAPRLQVLENALDLPRFAAPKAPEARFTLGLVGFSVVAKDPRWAVRVLRLLRAHDPRYRLLLIGDDLDGTTTAAAGRYHTQWASELAELETTGAIRRVGHTSDVPKALTEVGVILSTSVRESFHCAVIEGAASGAVPVVRDWPFFAGKPNGARTIFPPEWVVASPEEAAKRILAATATEQAWADEGRAAADFAINRWDWGVVARRFDDLLLQSPKP